MRYDAEHKARTRARVVRVASEAIRADGPQGAGVAEIMARAGLTHGGFYAHFSSKDDMVAEAVGAAFDQSAERMQAVVAPAATGREKLRTYVRAYLSRSHRDDRGSGCPVAALAADMPRLGPQARARFGEGLAALTVRLASMMKDGGVADAEALAPSVLAEMQGALALARAVSDPGQSDLVLQRSRRALLARLGLEQPQSVHGAPE